MCEDEICMIQEAIQKIFKDAQNARRCLLQEEMGESCCRKRRLLEMPDCRRMTGKITYDDVKYKPNQHKSQQNVEEVRTDTECSKQLKASSTRMLQTTTTKKLREHDVEVAALIDSTMMTKRT